MSYREVMEMPLRAFWTYNGSVDRIRAEAELRQLQVLAASQSSEAFKEVAAALKEELKTPVVVIDNRRDENATEKLKAILGQP